MNDHKILIIDTTLSGISIGIATKELPYPKLIYESLYLETQDSARVLPMMYQQVRHLCPDDLYGIILANGPGSFTGIKVGYSFVLGLLRGGGLPHCEMRVASSLASISYWDETSVFLLPSTKFKGYVGFRGKIEIIEANQTMASKLHKVNGGIANLSVTMLRPWPQAIPYLDEKQDISLTTLETDQASSLSLRCLAKIFDTAQIVTTDDPITVNYMRKSTAEERLEEK